MILDSKGKLFGKISIVDILIVLILIAAAFGAYYKFGKSDTVTPFTKTDKVKISFYMEDVPDYVAKAAKVGDTVKDKTQNILLGKATDIKVGPDVIFYPNSSGQAIASSKPGYASIVVTAECQGIYSDTGVTIGGIEYYLNKQFFLRVGTSEFYIRVSGITK